MTTQEDKELAKLEAILGIDPDQPPTSPGENPVLCDSLKRVAQLKFKYMVRYQRLVYILSVVALLILVFAGWRLVTGDTIEALVFGAGAIVTGLAANFIVGQKKEAQKTYAAALRGLEKHNCR